MTDEEMFTEGACGQLALEIHRLTGWEVCSFGNYEGMHYFVRLPNGNYLDVRGEQTEAQMNKLWCYDPINPVSPSFYQPPRCDELAVFDGAIERAEELAPVLLAALNVEIQVG